MFTRLGLACLALGTLLALACQRTGPELTATGGDGAAPRAGELISEQRPPDSPEETGVEGPRLQSSSEDASSEYNDAGQGVQRPLAETDFAVFLARVERERRWRTAVDQPTPAFNRAVEDLFDEAASVLTQLTGAGQRAEADRLCSKLTWLQGQWGARLLSAERFNAFLRDRFWIGEHRVEGAQFFTPVPFSAEEPERVKHFRLTVYQGETVLRRYYLERQTSAEAVDFTLGRVDGAGGDHKTLHSFGVHQPSYWGFRDRAVEDLNLRPPEDGGSSQIPGAGLR